MKWLLNQSDRGIIERHSEIVAHSIHSDEQLAEHRGLTVAEVVALRDGATAAAELEVAEGVARIDIRGPLLDAPYWLYDYFGVEYSDYQTITALVHQAEGNPDVESIVLNVDSPGGMVRGVFAAADTLNATTKPVTAVVSGMAASAGYLLASQANHMVATSRADEFGSIGVAIDAVVFPEVVSIASTDAPAKRPDLTTEAGREMVRTGELDPIHELFVDAITRSRAVTAADVSRDFGRGGLVLARDALRVGMIDELQEAATQPPAASAGHAREPGASVTAMNLSTLKAEHPEAYAAAVALGKEQAAAEVDAKVTAAVEAERKRCHDHLRLGKRVGGLDLAIDAVKSGEPVDPIDYVEASLGRERSGERAADNPPDISGATSPAVDESEITNEFLAAAESIGVSPDEIQAIKEGKA